MARTAVELELTAATAALKAVVMALVAAHIATIHGEDSVASRAYADELRNKILSATTTKVENADDDEGKQVVERMNAIIRSVFDNIAY